MNPYSEDELTNGDDFPVTGGFPLPSDIESEYKFILVGPDDEWVCDLSSEFVPDEGSAGGDCPDVWSSESAYVEALSVVGYNVKVVKA